MSSLTEIHKKLLKIEGFLNSNDPGLQEKFEVRMKRLNHKIDHMMDLSN